MRDISEKGIALIKEFEGCSLKAYKPVPTEKYWTIGWGHYGSDVKQGQVISQSTADKMLKKDLKSYVNDVNNINYCPVTHKLNQNQFDALVSFCYNCGAGNLRNLCSGKTVEQIGKDILLYNKAGGVVLKGLERRRKAENKLYNTFCPYKVKTTVEGVKVRKKPKKKATILQELKLGHVCTIVAEKVVDGVKYGQLQKSKCWIKLKNTKKI